MAPDKQTVITEDDGTIEVTREGKQAVAAYDEERDAWHTAGYHEGSQSIGEYNSDRDVALIRCLEEVGAL